MENQMEKQILLGEPFHLLDLPILEASFKFPGSNPESLDEELGAQKG